MRVYNPPIPTQKDIGGGRGFLCIISCLQLQMTSHPCCLDSRRNRNNKCGKKIEETAGMIQCRLPISNKNQRFVEIATESLVEKKEKRWKLER